MSRSRQTNSEPLVDPDRLGVADGFADALKGQHDVFASIAEARIDGWREAAESVHDREYTDLGADGQLVMTKSSPRSG